MQLYERVDWVFHANAQPSKKRSWITSETVSGVRNLFRPTPQGTQVRKHCETKAPVVQQRPEKVQTPLSPPDWRLIIHTMQSKAANTRLALPAGQLLMPALRLRHSSISRISGLSRVFTGNAHRPSSVRPAGRSGRPRGGRGSQARGRSAKAPIAPGLSPPACRLCCGPCCTGTRCPEP